MTTERDTFDQALKALMVAENTIDPDQIITSYILVGAAVGGDRHRTVYFRDYLGGEQPRHLNLGLLALAQRYENEGLLDDEGNDL